MMLPLHYLGMSLLSLGTASPETEEDSHKPDARQLTAVSLFMV
jgi:hypothetical protein